MAFAATNVDDIFLLMMFFSPSSRLAPRQVVIGQYAGFVLLVSISAVASLLGLVLPTRIIGIFGVLPIAIGAKKLYQAHALPMPDNVLVEYLSSKSRRRSYLSVSKVAGVTFTSGSDNIGVYVPLFASHVNNAEIVIIVAMFLGMTGVWCAIGRYVPSHPMVAKQLGKFGHVIFPFALIAIGISLLVGVFA